MPTQNNIRVMVWIPTETPDTFTKRKEYDPLPHSAARLTNPAPSSTAIPSPTLATPLVKFVSSTTDKQYSVMIQVLPGYDFADPSGHDFLRFTLSIDGVRRVTRTVSTTQIAARGEDGPWTIVIHCDDEGRHFVWKEIGVKEEEEGGEAGPRSEWDYDVGTVRVCVERMREEEVGEDAGGLAGVGAEGGGEEGEERGEDAGGLEGGRGEEEGGGETEDAGEAESDDEEMEDVEEEGGLVLDEGNLEHCCLSHYTAYVWFSLRGR